MMDDDLGRWIGKGSWSESPEYEAKRKDIQERMDIVWRQKGKRKSEKGVRRKVEREGGRHEEQKLLSSPFIANCVPPILQSDWSDLTAYGTA